CRTAGWRRRRPPANRLPSREPLLFRLPDGRIAPAVLRELVRLLTLRGTHPCCPTPGPRRHRCRTPPPAAPQVFEGYVSAGRYCPAPVERSGSHLPRRAHVRARSAWSPRGSLAD